MLKRLFTAVLVGGPLALIPTAASATPSWPVGGYEVLDHGQEQPAEDDHDHDGDGKPDHDPEDHDKDQPKPKPKPKG
ncbi:MAG: hypothetical protein AB1679_28715 [Actinomycetota bacterium]|jgi:hypothetical protein